LQINSVFRLASTARCKIGGHVGDPTPTGLIPPAVHWSREVHRQVLEYDAVGKKKEARRLGKLKRESESHESRHIAKRYKLPEAAVALIEKAGTVHGQQSRAIQVAVELLWNMPGWGVSDEAMSHILNSPLTGKTYKLPPRTVGLINGLALEYGTKG